MTTGITKGLLSSVAGLPRRSLATSQKRERAIVWASMKTLQASLSARLPRRVVLPPTTKLKEIQLRKACLLPSSSCFACSWSPFLSSYASMWDATTDAKLEKLTFAPSHKTHQRAESMEWRPPRKTAARDRSLSVMTVSSPPQSAPCTLEASQLTSWISTRLSSLSVRSTKTFDERERGKSVILEEP